MGKIIFILTVFISLLFSNQKNQEPIKIIINDWSSQIVLSHVIGKTLESLGYRVEYPFYLSSKQFGAMNLGWAHVQIEIWEGTMMEDFEKVKKKNVLDLGSHSAKTREEWWYPSYVKELCPKLPNWEALKECYHLFATKNSNGKGVYLGGPWEKPDRMMIRALGLNFIVKRAKDSDEITEYMNKNIKAKNPILVFNWTPNWTELIYKGEFVEFPEYTKECEENPKWGVNSFYTYDCGNPKNGLLKKGIWKGVKTKWPCAYQFLKNIDFTNEMLAQAALYIDYEKMSYEEAANKWIEKYKKKLNSWIPKECKK